MNWIEAWRQWNRKRATAIRAEQAQRLAEWERDTEPGYPLPGWQRDARRMALAIADLHDALAGPEDRP